MAWQWPGNGLAMAWLAAQKRCLGWPCVACAPAATRKQHAVANEPGASPPPPQRLHPGGVTYGKTFTAADCRKAAQGLSEVKLTSGFFLKSSKHNALDDIRKEHEVNLTSEKSLGSLPELFGKLPQPSGSLPQPSGSLPPILWCLAAPLGPGCGESKDGPHFA